MNNLNCIICTIGDEIVDGRTLDTNSQAIATFLSAHNITVSRLVSITDKPDEIVQFYTKELKQFNLIITTGGLGPTKDDKTRRSLSKALNWDFICDQGWLSHLVSTWNFSQEQLYCQALLPKGATLIRNNHGTSCGFIKESHQKIYVFLPGVPGECLSMLEPIVSYLQQIQTNLSIEPKEKLCIHGIYEREIDETLVTIKNDLDLPIRWGLYPGLSQVKVYIHAPEAEQKLVFSKLKEKYQRHLYSGDIVNDLTQILKTKKIGLTIEGERHSTYLKWLCDLENPSNTKPGWRNLILTMSHHESLCTIEIVLDGQSVLSKEKNVVGQKDTIVAQKSAFWAISEMILYLNLQV